MKIIEIDCLANVARGEKLLVATGLFETMHIGHQFLINKAIKLAADNDLKPAIVTVSSAINKKGTSVFPNSHRFKMMQQLGIEVVYVISMNEQTIASSPEQFITFLKEIGVEYIVCGQDYRFANKGKGTVAQLAENFQITIVDFITYFDDKVSTTRIKQLLKQGNIAHTNKLLGYNYYIEGEVTLGKQLGRTIGVPTANVYPSVSPLARGVYLSKTKITGKWYKSITNVGYNPTVGDNRLSIETYIGDGFDSDVYGQQIHVEMIAKIRDEKKFDSLDDLVHRLQQDIKYMEETDYENY